MTEVIIIVLLFIFIVGLIIYDKVDRKNMFGTIVIDETSEDGTFMFLEIHNKNWQRDIKDNDKVIVKIRIKKSR